MVVPKALRIDLMLLRKEVLKLLLCLDHQHRVDGLRERQVVLLLKPFAHNQLQCSKVMSSISHLTPTPFGA